MTLAAGARLGPYEIQSALGAGGMGEVYRARDTKLDRSVAIKILPESFAHDPDRLARFEREAKTLAALNHSNIATVYGLAEADGRQAIAMELVEGQTLADRLTGPAEAGPHRKDVGSGFSRIGLDEALAIARQIAEALEAAHEQGIIHRDLKPANIKVRSDGTVKVLDFGLAKALDTSVRPEGRAYDNREALSHSPTITSPAGLTGMGMLLGTAAYMAPEQARGKPVDKRVDIWAFGCVLYEMLTGCRAFEGEDVAETIGAVIHKEPAWSALPSNTPPGILRVLRRCLEKNPKQRLRDIGDARLEIENAVSAPFAGEAGAASAAPALPSRSGLAGWLVAAVLAVVAAAVAFVHFAEQTPDSLPSMRFEIGAPEKTTLATGGMISPDGRSIAFGARDDRGVISIWVRRLDSLEARRLAGTERNTPTLAFFWSPDSRFIAYPAGDRTLKKIDVSGGPALTITDLDGNYSGGSWSRDNVVIFGLQGRGLQRVSADGGTASALTTLDQSRETSHTEPVFLPDGRHFLYTRLGNDREESDVYVGSLDGVASSVAQPLLRAASRAVFSPSSDPDMGHLVFTRGSTLMMQPFDAARIQLRGEAVRLADDVPGSGTRTFSVSTTGIVAFRGAAAASGSRLMWFDRQGRSLGQVGPPGQYGDVALTSDGKNVVVAERDAQTDTVHLWRIDLRSHGRIRLSPGNQRDGAPAASHDGRIVFSSGTAGDLYVRPASGGGEAELLLKSASVKFPGDWTSDDRFIIYDDTHPSQRLDLWVLPLGGDRKPIPFLATRANENLGKFSPDDHWVAYVSDESGRREVYVRDFAPDRVPAVGSERIPISTAGGGRPRWRPDGTEIYYIAPDGKMMTVPVKLGPPFEAGIAVPLFDTNVAGTMSYDVTADGRFLVNTISEQDSSSSPPITVVMNWQAALKK
jgi:eukaryotic-like serine/threonine-protein kinase